MQKLHSCQQKSHCYFVRNKAEVIQNINKYKVYHSATMPGRLRHWCMAIRHVLEDDATWTHCRRLLPATGSKRLLAILATVQRRLLITGPKVIQWQKVNYWGWLYVMTKNWKNHGFVIFFLNAKTEQKTPPFQGKKPLKEA